LIYKTNIFIKLLKLYFIANVITFFCGIWAFSSSRKHLLITVLRLEFVVLVLYFSVYFYLCRFNYSLFFLVYFLVFSVCEGSLGLSILVSMFVVMEMIIFNLTVVFNVKVFIFSYLFDPLISFFLVLMNGLFIVVFYIFRLPFFFS